MAAGEPGSQQAIVIGKGQTAGAHVTRVHVTRVTMPTLQAAITENRNVRAITLIAGHDAYPVALAGIDPARRLGACAIAAVREDAATTKSRDNS